MRLVVAGTLAMWRGLPSSKMLGPTTTSPLSFGATDLPSAGVKPHPESSSSVCVGGWEPQQEVGALL